MSIPELPEVETVRRQIETRFRGAQLVATRRVGRRVDRYQPLPAFARVAMPLTAVARHGKFLVFMVAGFGAWVVHLGMSGRAVVLDHGTDDPAHLAFEFRFSESGLGIVDPRTFGSVRFARAFSCEPPYVSLLTHLGPDPMTQVEGARNNLSLVLSGTQRSVKTVLLDQRVIAGVGNMYADEALHRAGIAPDLPGCSLGQTGSDRLFESVRWIFAAALDKGGTSFPDRGYRDLGGQLGRFGPDLAVYMRAGKSCPRCSSIVIKELFGKRHTYRCPLCQARAVEPCT